MLVQIHNEEIKKLPIRWKHVFPGYGIVQKITIRMISVENELLPRI